MARVRPWEDSALQVEAVDAVVQIMRRFPATS